MSQPSVAIVIAGASGDLARRKLIPALDALFQKGRLGPDPLIVGSGRSAFTDEQFVRRFAVSAPFAHRLHYHQHIKGIKRYIDDFGSFQRVVFFLALPPEAYAETAEEIAAEGFGDAASIVIEKPFGYDVASARALNRRLACFFEDSRIFRIDHYLAKEAVQNILVFRFANPVFRPIWNGNYIESIQISALEDIGVERRGAYFDKAGIIRDMVQNHLLQMLCLIAMEEPLTLRPEDICCRKIDILRTLRIEDCHRFQYTGYRSEEGVDPQSSTETFVQMRLSINNYRWSGTPVYLRAGKAVHRRGAEIGIRFRRSPPVLYNEKGNLPPNTIIFKIQPAEGIILDIVSKVPGTDSDLARSTMNFCYRPDGIDDAYQRLLYDVLRNDRTLFVNSLESEAAWEVVEPVLDRGTLGLYERGKMPENLLQVQWIDFDSYRGFCGGVKDCNLSEKKA